MERLRWAGSALALVLAMGCADDAAPRAPDAATSDVGAGHDGGESSDADDLDAGDVNDAGATESTLTIPAAGDWTDHGPIFGSGAEGEWDLYLWGAFAATAISRGGVIFLYYQGSNGYDEVEDTVTFRAVGVATSTDGFSYTKHAGNPVLTWWPNDSLEEGAVSTGGYVLSDGRVRLYYGANTAYTGSLVHADARIAESSDGYAFTDRGVLLDYTDSTVWGSGDELFPLAAFADGASRFVYYVPNGVAGIDSQLGVAWGAEDGIVTTAPVQTSSDPVRAWGPAGSARLGPDEHAVFVSNVRAMPRDITAYIVHPSAPDRFERVETYAFENMASGTVMFDEARETWFLFYRTAEGTAYGLRTAPAVFR